MIKLEALAYTKHQASRDLGYQSVIFGIIIMGVTATGVLVIGLIVLGLIWEFLAT